MNEQMEEQIATIKSWLGTGSINFFGFPMSGKDTQGIRLAEAIDAKFLSSGMIIRAQEIATEQSLTDTGHLIPSDIFSEWVIPYFYRHDLMNTALILSSIGRWQGEENLVMTAATESEHPLKAVVLLNISQAAVEKRFEAAKTLGDRDERRDDRDINTFRTRISEFRKKTMPVLEHYHNLGLLINIKGDQSREAVFKELVDKLATFTLSHPNPA